MECNRDEAVRAREMAEQKLALQDYAAAKKFALKAQQLFPALENIAQVIAVIDVHVAAQVRIGADEKDWYGILQIEPTADDAVVKKQYRKLALFLHPDKNKSIGAESAFKLIGEALQVLSDKVKRLVYDTKRGTHARANHASAGNPQGPGVNGRYGPQQHQLYPDGAAHSDAFNKASQQRFPQPPLAAPQLHPFTFWTACSSCQMRYQYFRKYENQNLLCPQCRRPFIAKDLSNLQRVNVTQAWPPQAGQSNLAGLQPGLSNPAGLQTGQSNPHLSANFGADGLRFFNSFASGGRADSCQNLFGAGSQFKPMGAATSAKNGADCTTKRREKVEAEVELSRKIEELRRARVMEKELAKQKEQMKKSKAIEKAQEALAKSMMKKEQAEKVSVKVKKKRGKKHKNSSSSESEETDEYSERATGEGGRDSLKVYPRRSSRSKRNVTYNSNESDDDFQEVPSGKKVRVETEVESPKQAPKGVDMAKKLADLAKNAIRMKLNLQTGRPGVTASALDEAQEKNKNASGLVKRHELPEGKTEQLVSHGSEDGVLANCTVPDADFHDFDEGREEKDVEVGQIWALYDDKDGMPKYYMKVKEIHSHTPFKVLIGWFEMRKPSEEVCKLLDLGFSFTCGEFRISSSQVMDSVNSFSHLVKWEKGGKGIVKIYPKKGEIWCIYKDWEPRQQVVKTSDSPLKYSMVEILTDCNENSGATVMLLNKVEGFKTAFQLLNEQVLQVPFLELLRFSHQVPAHKLKCAEAPGIPENCWELDPAAVPLSLIYPDLNNVKVGTD